MAILIGNTIALAPSSAAATSYTVPLSTLGLDLQEDDYVVIGMVSNNTSATLSETSGLGTTWDTSGKLNLASGARGWLTWAKVTAGPTISNPTFTHSASGTGIWQVWVEVWRDCDTTGATPFKDSLVATDHGSVAAGNITTTAMTPVVDDCTILYFVFESNGTEPGPMRFLSDKVVCEAKQTTDASVYTSYVVGTVQQQTKAATAQTCYGIQSQRFGSIVLAIRNKTGGAMCRDSRAGITKMAWFGNFGTKIDGAITWGKLVDMVAWTGGQIAGITVDATSAAPTESSLAGFSPAWGTYSALGNSRSVASEWTGGYYSLPSAVNMTGKLFSLEWFFQNLGAQVGAEGAIVAFADASGNAKVFRLAPRLAMDPGVRYTSMIDLANGTSIHTEGTGAPWSAVTKFGIGYNRAGTSTTPRTIAFRNALLHAATTMTGGSASQPLDITYLDKVLNGWGYGGLCDKLGDTVVAKTPVQFGDGTVKTYIDATATSAGYPAAYDVTLQPLWNVPASAAGITLKASASDTFNMVACSFVTESVQPLTIDAAYSTSATTSFAGATVVGPWDVTWKDGVPCASATFSGCGEIAGKGADWTNVIISDTASTDAALAEDTSGAVLTGLTIDGTGAAYALELGTAVTAHTLTDCTLTAGTTDKVHVKATTGTVTITISGTTSLIAADVTTDGATVVIAAPQPTLDATVLANSRVVLYNNTTNAELDNTAPAGTSWSKVITSGASANDSLTLHVFKEGYQEFSTTFLYTGDDATILVTQAVDSNIASLRTELGITDYTTITEFALDITGSVEIDADDADGSTTKARLAIWYNGVLTTENGARYLRGAITILSTAAFRINTSVLDLNIENISATFGLNFTDTERRLYRDDGAPIYAPASAPGSIQNDYSGVPDTVETGVSGLTGSESAQLMGLPNATSIAAAVWAYVITGSTTAVQMMRGFAAVLLGKVSGAGTGTETFRDIADTTDVVVATVDSDGNRTAITRTLT